MRFLLDEMYPIRLAERFRSRNVDAVAVLESVGLPAGADRIVLRRAHQDTRAVVTENVGDFLHLVRTQAHSGLVLLPARRWPRGEGGINRIADALIALDRSDHRQSAVHWLRPTT